MATPANRPAPAVRPVGHPIPNRINNSPVRFVTCLAQRLPHSARHFQVHRLPSVRSAKAIRNQSLPGSFRRIQPHGRQSQLGGIANQTRVVLGELSQKCPDCIDLAVIHQGSPRQCVSTATLETILISVRIGTQVVDCKFTNSVVLVVLPNVETSHQVSRQKGYVRLRCQQREGLIRIKKPVRNLNPALEPHPVRDFDTFVTVAFRHDSRKYLRRKSGPDLLPNLLQRQVAHKMTISMPREPHPCHA